MALTEIQTKKVETMLDSFLERKRPPEHIRTQLDLNYRIKNQTITIFEVRPAWHDPTTKIELIDVKITYVKSRKMWKVFWRRASGKWQLYEAVSDFADVIEMIEKDEHGCFWG